MVGPGMNLQSVSAAAPLAEWLSLVAAISTIGIFATNLPH